MIEEVVSEKYVPSEKYTIARERICSYISGLCMKIERISISLSGLCMKMCEMIRLHMAVGRKFRNFIFGSDVKIRD